MSENSSNFGLNWLERGMEMSDLSRQWYFSYSIKKSFEVIVQVEGLYSKK